MDLSVWQPADHSSTAADRRSILLIQEIFGVGQYIRDVAARLAEAGYLVGAPDVFWRIRPNFQASGDQAGLQEALAVAGRLDRSQAITDCCAAIERLHEISGSSLRPAVLGFCLGGTLAWGVAIEDSPSACVSYYGSGVADMLQKIGAVRCPTLFHFGDDDPYIPNESVDHVVAAIARRPGFVVNIERAGHAFDNHQAVELFYNESAAKAAWAKTLAFLDTHLRTDERRVG